MHCSSVFGLEQFEEVHWINQQALHQNRLSTPLSITGILGDIQNLFAKTEEAKTKGFKKADFSYQNKNGKCATCSGHGKIKTSMDFMSDIWLTCDTCNGQRYQAKILAVNFEGKSLGAIMQMTVLDALAFFTDKKVVAKLTVLQEVGLSHLILGQAGNTLSEGEAQRLKLANSILQKNNGKALYLFDEPSTGLHYFDMLPLLEVFKKLVKEGHTVLFIEHNATFIEAAHQVVKLGPGNGAFGGELVKF